MVFAESGNDLYDKPMSRGTEEYYKTFYQFVRITPLHWVYRYMGEYVTDVSNKDISCGGARVAGLIEWILTHYSLSRDNITLEDARSTHGYNGHILRLVFKSEEDEAAFIMGGFND